MQKTLSQYKSNMSPEREAQILYEIGLEQYEVEYLMRLKSKRDAGKHWRR